MKYLLLLLFGSSLTLGSFVHAQGPGEGLPDFTLVDGSGEVVNPMDYRGRPLLLNFWATWCPPCKEELPLLQEVAEEAPELHVLLINMGEERERAVAYLEANQIHLRTAVDPSAGTPNDIEATLEVAQRYRVFGLPTTLFVDGSGVIRSVWTGPLFPDILATHLKRIGVAWPP